MKSSLAILGCFALGGIAGALQLTTAIAWLHHPQAPTYALVALLFLVGIAVGSDAESWEVARKFGWKMLAIPAVVATGTLLGVALVSPLLENIHIRDALAVGSGLGYYSLSSVLITQLHGERLGVIALLANIIRELLTLVFAPLLVRYWGRLAPIAAGAATAMDTTLPVITRFSGVEYAAIAIFTGVVLMTLTPLLVTLFLTIGL